jgi:hypothetical protein
MPGLLISSPIQWAAGQRKLFRWPGSGEPVSAQHTQRTSGGHAEEVHGQRTVDVVLDRPALARETHHVHQETPHGVSGRLFGDAGGGRDPVLRDPPRRTMSLWSTVGPVSPSPHVTCPGCGTRWSSARAPQLCHQGAVCPRCSWPLITRSYADAGSGEDDGLARGVSPSKNRHQLRHE